MANALICSIVCCRFTKPRRLATAAFTDCSRLVPGSIGVAIPICDFRRTSCLPPGLNVPLGLFLTGGNVRLHDALVPRRDHRALFAPGSSKLARKDDCLLRAECRSIWRVTMLYPKPAPARPFNKGNTHTFVGHKRGNCRTRAGHKSDHRYGFANHRGEGKHSHRSRPSSSLVAKYQYWLELCNCEFSIFFDKEFEEKKYFRNVHVVFRTSLSISERQTLCENFSSL